MKATEVKWFAQVKSPTSNIAMIEYDLTVPQKSKY